MHYYWEMSRDHGSMSNADYGYEGKNGKCRHDDSKSISSAKNWG